MNELTQLTQDFSLVPTESRTLVQKAIVLLEQQEPSETRMSEYQAKQFVASQYPTPWRNYKQTIGEIESRLSALVDEHYLARMEQGYLMQWQWIARWAMRVSYVIGWFTGVAGVATAKVAWYKCRQRFHEQTVKQKLKELQWYEDMYDHWQPQIEGKDRAMLERQSWEAEAMKREREEVSKSVSQMARLKLAQALTQQELASQAFKEDNHAIRPQ